MINKKRVLNIENYLNNFKENQLIGIGLIIDDHSFDNTLNKIGFTEKIGIGERILPAINGRISKFNAEGKETPLKNIPKEDYVIEREWTWKQWKGSDTVENSKIVYINRERYQREHINAPEIEIEIKLTSDNKKIVIADFIEYSSENYDKIKHTINLFLELFGCCDTFDEKFKTELQSGSIIKLNWKLLKPGVRNWSTLKEELAPIFNKAKKTKKLVIEDRLEKINSYSPDFIAVGQAGYSGYIVFGFKDKNKFVLENNYYGNAIYIFDENWETLSKMTKTEVLYNNLYIKRILHQLNWKNELDEVLK